MSEIDSQDENGLTALHHAVIKTLTSLCSALLAKGADPNIKDINGRTPLHYAVLEGDCVIIDKLLEKNTDINVTDINLQTPLHIASNSCLKVVKKLLNKGAELEMRDILYQTPLHHAACSGAWLVVSELIERGAQLTAKNSRGQTPLHVAVDAYKHSFKWVSVERITPKIVKTIRVLTFRGAELNAHDDMGDTVLHYCVTTSSLELVDLFLTYGASLESRNHKGQTALHTAGTVSNWEQFEHLLQLDIDPFIKDNNELTALHILLCNHIDYHCEENCTNSLKIPSNFSDPEAVINKHNSSGLTALHYAVSLDLVYTVKLLLQEGADPEAKDMEGQTALHLAAITNGLAFSILLKNGVNVNAKRSNGDTALHILIEYGGSRARQQSITQLLDSEAEVNSRNSLGRTPLFIALNGRRISLSCINILLGYGARIGTLDRFGNQPSTDVVKDFCPLEFSDLWHHIIMAKTVNFEIDTDVPVPRMALLHIFYKACTKEVEKLKLERFDNYSLYDVFCKYDHPIYVLNASLEMKVNSVELGREFPIYSAFLRTIFKRAKRRFTLINSAKDFFSLIKSVPFQLNIPHEMKQHILSLLKDEDLQNILDICSS